MPFISGCCEGERCYCGKPAEHKVEETIFFDDPHQGRHPLTTYICHEHFREIMGPHADAAQYRERQSLKSPMEGRASPVQVWLMNNPED